MGSQGGGGPGGPGLGTHLVFYPLAFRAQRKGGRLTLPAGGTPLTCFLISLDLLLPPSSLPGPPARPPGLQAECGLEGDLRGPWGPISPPHRRSRAGLGATGSEGKGLGSVVWPQGLDWRGRPGLMKPRARGAETVALSGI